MQPFYFTLRDSAGNSLPAFPITIYQSDGVTPVPGGPGGSLFDPTGTTHLSNPFNTDQNGRAGFTSANGNYVAYADVAGNPVTLDVQLFDGTPLSGTAIGSGADMVGYQLSSGGVLVPSSVATTVRNKLNNWVQAADFGIASANGDNYAAIMQMQDNLPAGTNVYFSGVAAGALVHSQKLVFTKPLRLIMDGGAGGFPVTTYFKAAAGIASGPAILIQAQGFEWDGGGSMGAMTTGVDGVQLAGQFIKLRIQSWNHGQDNFVVGLRSAGNLLTNSWDLSGCLASGSGRDNYSIDNVTSSPAGINANAGKMIGYTAINPGRDNVRINNGNSNWIVGLTQGASGGNYDVNVQGGDYNVLGGDPESAAQINIAQSRAGGLTQGNIILYSPFSAAVVDPDNTRVDCTTLRPGRSFRRQGQFSPVIAGDGGGTPVSAYSTQQGWFLCSDDFIWMNCNLIVTGSPTGPVGNVLISDLPFTFNSFFANALVPCTVEPVGISLSSGYTQFGVRLLPNSSSGQLMQYGNNVSGQVPFANLNSGCAIRLAALIPSGAIT